MPVTDRQFGGPSVQSSISNSVLSSPSKDVLIPDVPTSGDSVSDMISLLTALSSHRAPSALMQRELQLSILASLEMKFLSDVSSLSSVNTVSSSKVSTTDLSILKNERNDLLVSGISLGNSSGSSRFEHDLCSPTGHMMIFLFPRMNSIFSVQETIIPSKMAV